jgi:hypothetical protein
MRFQFCYKHDFIVLLCFFSLVNTKAQEENFSFCQKVPSWNEIIIDSAFVTSKAAILIVSNRSYQPQEHEFLPNDIDRWRLISYFLAYCEDSQWHLTKVDSFKESMDAINNGKDLLLFVHGHGKSFPAALSRVNLVNQRYSINTILFDWPSQNSNFNKSLSRVRHCGENFYNLMLQLQDYRLQSMQPNQHLSLMANSLGNYFLTHLVVNGNNQYLNTVFIDNLLLNAAAVKTQDQDEVISQFHFQKQIYVTINKNDRVLRGAHLLTYGKMLGNFVYPPLVPNTDYIHFTPLVGKLHNYYAGYNQVEYNHSVFFDFYNTVLHGKPVNLNNEKYYKIRPEGDGYEVVGDL